MGLFHFFASQLRHYCGTCIFALCCGCKCDLSGAGIRMKVIQLPSLLVIGAALLLGGCTTPPTAPTITILPGVNKSQSDFHTDYAACQHNIKPMPENSTDAPSQQSYNAAFGQCMYTLGTEVPGVYPSHSVVPLPAPLSPLFAPPPVNRGYAPAN